MVTSTSRLSYQDCFDLMERAIAGKGLRVEFGDYGAANHFRLRMHKARAIDRKENQVTYKDQVDHPMYGRSFYDPIVCRIKREDEKWWLYIEQNSIAGMVIEELGEPEPEPEQRRA